MLSPYFIKYIWITLLGHAFIILLALTFAKQSIKKILVTLCLLIMVSTLFLTWKAPDIVHSQLAPKLDAVEHLPSDTIDAGKAPWNAIGRVAHKDKNGLYSCSGTLIAPDKVLTAAHCLVDEQSGLFLAAAELFFTLPHSNITAEVVSYRAGKNFNPVNHKTPENSRDDWAVLTLKTALKTPPLPLASKNTPSLKSKKLYAAGYPPDLHQPLYVLKNCEIIKGFPLSFFLGFIDSQNAYEVHNCAVNKGASGGPLLAQTSAGTYEIQAIHIVRTTQMDISLGVALSVRNLNPA